MRDLTKLWLYQWIKCKKKSLMVFGEGGNFDHGAIIWASGIPENRENSKVSKEHLSQKE